ncbi:MAG: MBL fold metallo-hydrolase [Deltaproteobacteria bacterium]|nr:MBL fold metallo-hydrolase [Nannocystaceae bacterium]
MELCYLGHAMWLCEAAGLRLLCDPLLGRTHHCGVFEVVPRRAVDAAALRADFVLVSHRHPDHFDVASLHRLARLDADSVVVTPDPLVVWAARALGFTDVRQVPPGTAIDLDGVRMVTTPSLDPAEWGVMVAAGDASWWNQVDTVQRGPAQLAAVREAALAGLGATHLDLAAVRWQPMLEIAAQLGESLEFPYRAYDRLLREIAACGATAVVPASCGGSHVAPWEWLDRIVFPLSEARVRRDLAALAPALQVFAGDIGARWRIAGGAIDHDPGGARALVELDGVPDPRRFDPMVVPALVDPNPSGTSEAIMRPRVRRWIEDELVPGIAESSPRWGADDAVRLVIRIVWPSCEEHYTLLARGRDIELRCTADPEWDVLDAIAGSLLWEVVEGRRGWGDVLLAGALRARTRAYRIEAGSAADEGRLRQLDIGATFLYYGLSYDASTERAVRWEVERALAGG